LKNVFASGKSPVKVQPKTLEIFLGELYIVYMGREHVSLRVVNVTWTEFDPLAFILYSFNQFWIAARLVCSVCIATARSLSVLSTAVSSTKFAVVGSGGAASLQCIPSIIIALGHCLGVRRH
jgi:hypothetical protein